MSRAQIALLTLILAAAGACSRAQKEAPETAAPPAQQPAVQQPATPQQPEVAAPEAAPAAASRAPSRQETRTGEERRPAPRRRSDARSDSASAPVTRSEPAQSTPPPATAPPVDYTPATPPVRSAESATPPTPALPKYATVPSGTAIGIRLVDALDSAANKAGDSFRGTLDQDLVIDGTVVASKGAAVRGKVSSTQQSGRVQGRAQMALELTNCEIGGQDYPIQTKLLNFAAESTKKQDAEKVGIGAGIGAVIGAIAGGGKGAAIGAAVGGAAGGGTVIATRGQEVQFEPEHKLNFALSKDVQVRLR
jgi:hypothetical protein